jgi:DNA mismatch repair protein MutH
MKVFAELMTRYSDAEGVPFLELAQVLKLPLPDDPRKDKGYSGRLVERIAMKWPDSASKPDLTEFDVEIKSVSVRLNLTPLQPTKITSLNPDDLKEGDWFESHVYRKLRIILFVPVVKAHLGEAAEWYIRRPFIWLPSSEDLIQLQQDWAEIRAVVNVKGIAGLSSSQGGPGSILMTKTSYEGGAGIKKRYAFWFRPAFTKEVLRQNVSYTALSGVD